MTHPSPSPAGQSCAPSESSPESNRNLLLPYVIPYVAYVALASLFDLPDHATWVYSLRVILTPALLLFFWHRYVMLTGPLSRWGSVLTGIAAGIIGCIVWVVLVGPFTDPRGGAAWSDTAFILRLSAATLIVPVFEELLMRGFVFRFALQWEQARNTGEKDPLRKALDDSNISRIPAGEWSWFAIAISTALFTLGHRMHEWPAAIAYSLLISGLWVIRKDLLSCIVAHGTTNLLLALYVRTTGTWGLW